MYDDRFLSVVSHHMLNLDFTKIGDGIKQLWGEESMKQFINQPCGKKNRVQCISSIHKFMLLVFFQGETLRPSEDCIVWGEIVFRSI